MTWRKIPSNPNWHWSDETVDGKLQELWENMQIVNGIRTDGDHQIFARTRRAGDSDNADRGEISATYWNAQSGVFGLQDQSYYSGLPSATPGSTSFIFTLETTGVDEQFEIGANNVGTFDAEIDWGDGETSTVTSYNDPNLTHTYAEPGTHTVSISGTFPNVEFENSFTNALKLRTVVQLGVVGWLSLNSAFKNCRNVTSFASGTCDTSAVTDMTSMFELWESCTSFDVSTMNTSNVTNMSRMFYDWQGSSSVSTIDFSNFDTSNVTNMSRMFQYNEAIDNIDVSSFDTSSVTDMSYMFHTTIVNSIDISGLNTSSVTTFYRMFRGSDATTVTTTGFGSLGTGLSCSCGEMFYDTAATSLNLASFDTSNVTNMSYMFYISKSLTTIGDVSGWNTSSATNMSGMFTSLGLSSTTKPELDLSSWNTSNVTDMSQMFSGAGIVGTLDLSSWNTSNVTDMSQMFRSMRFITGINISNWNTSNVTNMYLMFDFNDASTITTTGFGSTGTGLNCSCEDMFGISGGASLDLSSFDTSNVTNMRFMFAGNIGGTLDLSSWNTSSVTTMRGMFFGFPLPTLPGLSSFDTSNVTDMSLMFSSADIGGTLDLSSWNTSSVTTMYEMFRGMVNITEINVSNWDTSSATTLSRMFRNNGASTITTTGFGSTGTGLNCSCYEMFYDTAATSLNLASFDTSNVTNMNSMFSNSSSLTTIGNLSGWNTSSATNMSGMFSSMPALTDVAIDSFNVESVTAFGSFMLNTTIPVARYDATLIAWDAQTVQPNESINFGTNQYTGGGAAEAARTSLINNDGWTITDGGSV